MHTPPLLSSLIPSLSILLTLLSSTTQTLAQDPTPVPSLPRARFAPRSPFPLPKPVAPYSHALPVVIAGSCKQETLQFCCPLVKPTDGEGSVEFAEDCMNGNLPASYDCFFDFQMICCGDGSNTDGNGDSCEVVPPTDICAPGAAGTIMSLGAVVSAVTVTSTVSCTASATSTITSTTATTTSALKGTG